jgi:perosamine synthetase
MGDKNKNYLNIIVDYFNSVTNKKKLSLHNPYIDKDEINLVKSCIKTTYVSNKSIFVNKFENKLKKIVKSKYVIAVNSGTAALGICLRALGVKRNDEVITSPLTFVATSNAISHVGAIPHFVDISEKNLGIDFIKLEKYLKKIAYFKKGQLFNKKTKRRISCILPVHVFGFPIDIKKMKKVKKQFNLKILEDSAECLGSYYNKIHLGNFGDMGVLSFNGNKIITTGGGGAIMTNNKRLYKISKHIASTAKKNFNFEYDHDKVAWNYIMPGINAAFGIAQLNKLKHIIAKKKTLHKNFCFFFKDYGNEIFTVSSEKNSQPNFWLNTLILKKLNYQSRNRLIKLLNLKGYEVRPVWKSLNTLPQFKKSPKSNLDNLKLIKNKIINLPSGFDIFSEI